VANNGVLSSNEASLPIPVRTRLKGQEDTNEASLKEHRYTEIRPKQCSEIYKVRKLYVGLLRDLPPPVAVQEKWDLEVRPDLERHLCQATSLLSKSLRDEEVITEAVLCMAGKKCTPSSVLLVPGATCPQQSVALKPTVWIYCGGRKCKKKVESVVRSLAYLDHFLDKFYMEPAYVSLHAPWPAAGESTLDGLHAQKQGHEISFSIQRPSLGQSNICGAKVKFIIQTSDGILERVSTFGGMIVVDNKVYGLTSAHAIVNHIIQNSFRGHAARIEPTSDGSNSDSEYEGSSDSESETSDESFYSLPRQMTHADRPTTESQHFQGRAEGPWTKLSLPKIVAYMGNGTTSGDYFFPISSPKTSDFALIDLGTLPTLQNGFHDPDQGTIMDISHYIPTSNLSQGEVWIITSCSDQPFRGYLLNGSASLILRGTSLHTKKIQVAFPGGMLVC